MPSIVKFSCKQFYLPLFFTILSAKPLSMVFIKVLVIREIASLRSLSPFRGVSFVIEYIGLFS